MKVELVKPQGYCAGVLNAINVAKKAREENPNNNVYVLGMLVHNKSVIKELSSYKIKTLKNDSRIPLFLHKGDILIFTAHGHDEKLDKIATKKGLKIYDCTCPIVKKNLDLIKQEIKENHQVIYIGQKKHKETLAALAVNDNVSLYDTKTGILYNKITDDSPLVINQTTLNFLSLTAIHDDVKAHVPNARITNEICNATRLRQEAILGIEENTDLIIVVGDKKSSNSNKLYEIAKSKYPDKMVLMVENLNELKKYQLSKYKKATISSGASTPIKIVEEIKDYLENYLR